MLDFEALETAARRKALAVSARVLERHLNSDHSDRRASAPPCPSCSAQVSYQGRRSKPFRTVLGKLQLERAYYYCARCKEGFCPRDRALGMEQTSLSPALTRMIGTVGAMVSFAEGSQLLSELAGVEIDPKQVERGAESLGEEVAAWEQSFVEAPSPAEPIPPTLYLGMDGTGAPMRPSELLHRPGKQPDGSAKTREVKLVTVWSAEGHDAQGVAVRDPGSVTYSAAIESAACRDDDHLPSEFAQRVAREATRRAFDRADRQVVLGDGAPWIWNLADEHFPRALQIVDRFHVKQHLADVAKAIFGPTDPKTKAWTEKRHDQLDLGKLDALLAALEPHIASVPEARRCRDYLDKNRHRMRYPHFHAQGLCTSSGVVEAACRVVVGQRLKRSGMRWTVRGANAIAALRCVRLSGRFEDFWESRANQLLAA